MNQEVADLLNKASLTQEDIKIHKISNLRNLFTNQNCPEQEIQELSSRGIELIISVYERNPLPWFSIGFLWALAAVQITLGIILVSAGAGNVGLAFMSEGVVDLLTSASTIYTREFSWTSYAKQKALSLAISAATLNLGQAKESLKMSWNVIRNQGLKESIEQSGQKIITSTGKSCLQIFKNSLTNLRSLGLKQVGVVTAEKTMQRAINAGFESLTSMGLEQFRSDIERAIQEQVEVKVNGSKLYPLLKKMYVLSIGDLKARIQEVLDSEHFQSQDGWDSTLQPFLTNLAHEKENVISLCFRIYGILKGAVEISTIIDRLLQKVLKQVTVMNVEEFSLPEILVQKCGFKTKEAKMIAKSLIEKQIVDGKYGVIFPNKTIEYDDKVNGEEERKAIEELKSLGRKIEEVNHAELSPIIKQICDPIVNHVLQILQSKLVAPITTYATGGITKAISERVQDRFIVDENENPESYKTESEREKKEFNTIQKQIMGNSQELANSYHKMKSIYLREQATNPEINNTTTQNKDIKLSNEIIDFIDGIENGRLLETEDMFSIAKEHNLDIKIVEDPNYIPTEDDIKNKTHIILKTPQKCYMLLKENGEIIDFSTEGNDSGCAAFEHLLGKSRETIRKGYSDCVQKNPILYHKIIINDMVNRIYFQPDTFYKKASMIGKVVRLSTQVVFPAGGNLLKLNLLGLKWLFLFIWNTFPYFLLLLSCVFSGLGIIYNAIAFYLDL